MTKPAPSSLRTTLTAALVVLPMTVSIIVINYWIYYARIEFGSLHPEYVAEQPPTISRAISDPIIGEPFAFWIGICAVLVVLGVVPICWLYARAGRSLPATGKGTRAILLTIAPLAFTTQVIAAVGMVILSHWRFPDNNQVHMEGSYVFFIAQALTVFLVGVACTRIATDAKAVQILSGMKYINPRVSRFRGPFAFGGVLLGFTFLGLFHLKDVKLPFGNDFVYGVYVLSEPALISYFLAVLATYYFEIFAFIRASAAGPDPLSEASRTPDLSAGRR